MSIVVVVVSRLVFMAPNVEFEEIIIDRETETLLWEK